MRSNRNATQVAPVARAADFLHLFRLKAMTAGGSIHLPQSAAVSCGMFVMWELLVVGAVLILSIGLGVATAASILSLAFLSWPAVADR